MEVNCPQCGKNVPGENINIEKCIAKCPSCSSIFQINGYQPKDRAAITLPRFMTLESGENMLTITRRWISGSIYGLVLLCLAWNGVFAMMVFVAFRSGSKGIPLFFLIFFAILGLAGIIILYRTISAFVNRTTITVDRNLLAITHGPLPWFGNKQIRSQKIEQLYTKEVIKKAHGSRHSDVKRYELRAILTTKTAVKLLAKLDGPEQALFIEQEVEKFLGIKDKEVRGEVGKQ